MFLTDREFWLNYWESHREEILVKVPEKNMLAPVFDAAIRNSNIKNSCELGGFPGTYSIYLRKKYGLDTTLVDYIIHQDILNETNIESFPSSLHKNKKLVPFHQLKYYINNSY